MKQILHSTNIIEVCKHIYEMNGLIFSQLLLELESQEYSACSFKLGNRLIKFRVAKITPKKTGQFVTFWKRINYGSIEPYDLFDEFDFLIVSVGKDEKLGQFIFPKAILYKYGVISNSKIGGKRAIRLYSPWDIIDNVQAKKTQTWQMNYFFEIQPNFDITKMMKLLTI